MAINNGLDNSLNGQSGTGSFVGTNAATLTSANIGTPTAGVLTNCTGLPLNTGVAGLGTNVATFLNNPTSSNLSTMMTDETGTGSLVFSNSPVLVTPNIGTPTAGTLTNCTGLPVSTGLSGLGTGISTFLSTPNSSNLRTAVTDSTGTGSLVFGTSPNFLTPFLGVSTATSISFTGSTNGIVGNNGASNASSGYVGEVIENSSASVSLTTNIVTNILSISLSPGDWDVWGTIECKSSSGTNATTSLVAAINNSSATLPADPNGGAFLRLNLSFTAGSSQSIPLGMRRFTFSSATTIYLVCIATFNVDLTGYGYIGARRRR